MTSDDIRSVKYFWLEKGDMERNSSWPELLPALRESYPEVIQAWLNYKLAILTLDAVVKAMPEGDD